METASAPKTRPTLGETALRELAAATTSGPDSGLTPLDPDSTVLALMNSAGRLLWNGSSGGTWTAQHGEEARVFSSDNHFRDWIAVQSDAFRHRLHAEGWRLVELVTYWRPHVPTVAEAVATEGGAA